jgi:hypothetical protein
MKINKISIITLSLAALAATACVNVSVSEPSACVSQAFSYDLSYALAGFADQVPTGTTLTGLCAGQFPAQAAGLFFLMPQLSTSATFDFSGALHDINKVSNSFNIAITQLSLANTNDEFSFVNFVDVNITGAPSTNPTVDSQLLATYSAPDAGPSTELNFTVSLPPANVQSLLQAGPVVVQAVLNNNPVSLATVCALVADGTLSTNLNMCVSADGNYKKTL